MDDKKQFTGMIMNHKRGLCQVLGPNNQDYSCRVKGAIFKTKAEFSNFAAGDQVLVEIDQGGQPMIVRLEKRETVYQRSNQFKQMQQVIAANCQEMYIVSAISYPDLQFGLVARFIAAANLGKIRPIIIISKSDLNTANELEAQREIYNKIGLEVIVHSIFETDSKKNLEQAFNKKTNLLVGASGVGKTSLVNMLFPAEDLAVAGLIKGINKGKHTTSAAQVYGAEESFILIDTPGIQELTPFCSNLRELAQNFQPFLKHNQGCRFDDCLHLSEPSCLVQSAVSAGEIADIWYQEYCRIVVDIREFNKQMRK